MEERAKRTIPTASPAGHRGGGFSDQRRAVTGPLWQALGPFTRAGGFYARSWADYLDRQPGELPVGRPSITLAAQAFLDEIVLLGFHLLRSAPDQATQERIHHEVIAALDFYGPKGWLEHPEGFFPAPPPPSRVSISPVHSRGRTYERMSFNSEYAPHSGEPGRERWLSYACNNRVYALMLRHSEPRPWLVCVHGAEMGRAALDLALFRCFLCTVRVRGAYRRAPRSQVRTYSTMFTVWRKRFGMFGACCRGSGHRGRPRLE
jgi:hypothetical protein